jgi:hypothetical protein
MDLQRYCEKCVTFLNVERGAPLRPRHKRARDVRHGPDSLAGRIAENKAQSPAHGEVAR